MEFLFLGIGGYLKWLSLVATPGYNFYVNFMETFVAFLIGIY
jgi:hypothetical protein